MNSFQIEFQNKPWLNWKGKNKFYCNGKISISLYPLDICNFIAMTLIIFATWFIFIFFPGYFLWINISFFFICFSSILLCLTLTFSLIATFSDPGFILRGNLEDPNKNIKNEKKQNFEENNLFIGEFDNENTQLKNINKSDSNIINV